MQHQDPRQLSFKQTVQVWLSWQQRGGETRDGVVIHALLVLIAEPRVGTRPGRTEPRAVKRRSKQFPLMTKPRKAARAEVIKHGYQKITKVNQWHGGRPIPAPAS